LPPPAKRNARPLPHAIPNRLGLSPPPGCTSVGRLQARGGSTRNPGPAPPVLVARKGQDRWFDGDRPAEPQGPAPNARTACVPHLLLSMTKPIVSVGLMMLARGRVISLLFRPPVAKSFRNSPSRGRRRASRQFGTGSPQRRLRSMTCSGTHNSGIPTHHTATLVQAALSSSPGCAAARNHQCEHAAMVGGLPLICASPALNGLQPLPLRHPRPLIEVCLPARRRSAPS